MKKIDWQPYFPLSYLTIIYFIVYFCMMAILTHFFWNVDFNGYYQQTINKECKLLIDIVTLLHTLQNCRTVFLDYFPKHMLDDCFYSGEETQQGSEHSAQDLGQAVDWALQRAAFWGGCGLHRDKHRHLQGPDREAVRGVHNKPSWWQDIQEIIQENSKHLAFSQIQILLSDKKQTDCKT